MTATAVQRRQPKGRPTGGEYAATVHAEPALTLAAPPAEPPAPEVPEKLRMAYIPAHNQLDLLEGRIRHAAEGVDAQVLAEFFAEDLPNLARADARARFHEALALAQGGHPYRDVLEDAAAADHAAAPYGAVTGGYIPPGIYADEHGYTQHATVGARHTGFRRASEIAKDVRAELKAAVAGNYLPQGLTFSVRSDMFAGGQSIDVTIQGLADEDRLHPTETNHHGDPAPRPEAVELEDRVKGILDAFNRQDNDGQIDYFNNTFYGRVEIEDDRWREFRAAEAARKKARTGQR